jgi:hypothetical protein
MFVIIEEKAMIVEGSYDEKKMQACPMKMFQVEVFCLNDAGKIDSEE